MLTPACQLSSVVIDQGAICCFDKKTAIRQYSQSEVSKNIVSKDAERVDVFEAVLLRLIARRTVM